MADPRYALVQDGKVHQLDVPAEWLDIPNMQIVDVSSAAGVAEGWIVGPDGSVSAPSKVVLTRADLSAYAASVRYAKETGGFTYQGHPIATDRDSQSTIGNAALGASIQGSAFSAEWKGSDGVFFPLDQSGMMAMALAVLAFVSACYSAEKTVQASVTAGSITTAAQIDGFSWPSNVVAAAPTS